MSIVVCRDAEGLEFFVVQEASAEVGMGDAEGFFIFAARFAGFALLQ